MNIFLIRPLKNFPKIIGLVLFLISSLSEAAIFTVTQANDAGAGPGTLTWAINQVNASPDLTNTINFSPLIGGNTVTLTANLPAITNTNTVNINGSGVAGLIISGGGAHTAFQVNGVGSTVNFSSLTIHQALNQAPNGAGGGNNPGGNALGAAISAANGANVTTTDVVLTNNVATGGNGTSVGGPAAGGNAEGAGIYVAQGATLSVQNANASTATVGNAVNGGAGAGGGANGVAQGSDLYIGNGVNVLFSEENGLTQTLVGTVAGPGGITKQGAGTLLLQGANTYAGGTTVSQGVLQGDATSLQGLITNNASVVFNIPANGGVAANQTYASVISGTGSVTVQGVANSILIYGNNNTYTGGTSIGTITLQMGVANALPATGAVTFINQNASLNLNNFDQTIGDLSGQGGISLGTATLMLGTANNTTYAGIIQGAGGSALIKQGTGNLMLTGANTFPGLTTITGGTVTLGANGSLAGPVRVNATSTLQAGGGTLGANQAITGDGSTTTTLLVTGAFAPTGLIQNIANITVQNGGGLTLNMNSLPTGFTNFSVQTGGTVTVGVGAGNLTIPAGATLNMAGTLTTNGQALANNGNIIWGGGAITGTILGGAASSLTITGNTTTTNPITNVTTINVTGGILTVGSAITGFNNFNIGSAGSVTLNNALNIDGATLVATGPITIGNNIISGNAASIFTIGSPFTASTAITSVGTINVVSGGSFVMGASPTGFNNFNIQNGGSGILNVALTLPANSTFTMAGSLNMNGNTITGNPGSVLTFSNSFSATSLISNVPTININGGTFTANTVPTGFTALNIGQNGVLALGVDFTIPANATLTNAGSLNMGGFNLWAQTGAILAINGGTLITSGTIAPVSGAGGYSISVANNGVLAVNNAVSGYNSFLIANGGTVSLNSGGSLLNLITLSGGGILNANGGSSNNITGLGTVNVNSAFNPTGTISVGSINVNSGGALTVSNPITVANGLTVNSGGILYLDNDVMGSLNNMGTLVHSENVVRNISGNFVQAGTLNVSLTDTGEFSQFRVAGNTTLNGGTIAVTLPSGGATINNNDTFNILTTNGQLNVTQLPTVSAPSSLILSFAPVATANGLQLVANRKTISSVNTVPAFNGLSTVLDTLRSLNNANNFMPLFGALDTQSTPAAFEQLLAQLVPEGVNGGTTQGSIAAQELVSQKIFDRTATLRAAYAAGDMAEEQGTYGPMVFGNTAKQQMRNGVPGYTTATGGFGILADAPVSRFLRVGGAVSYAGTSVKRGDSTGSNTSIMSFQGAFYTSSAYGPLFLDTLISLAYNNYQGKRNILALSQTATSKYQGTQYGCKVMGGFSLPFYGVEASPLASLQVVRLSQGSYTEQGASSANLSVSSRQLTASEVGLGVKVAETSQADDFLPEIHVLYIQDVKVPNLQVTSTFTGGGGAFVSTGPTPPRSGVNVGGSITTLLSENFLIVGNYDLESRKSYTSHSASLKFKYMF